VCSEFTTTSSSNAASRARQLLQTAVNKKPDNIIGLELARQAGNSG
jgi:hypothetical protein